MAHLPRTTQTAHSPQLQRPTAKLLGGPHFRLRRGPSDSPKTSPTGTDAYPVPRQQRYVSLDAWRGLACLLVVIFHSLFYCGKANAASAPGAQSLAIQIAERFWVGVPMFFVISGYCIAATVDSHRRRQAAGRSFFTRRLRRIVPPYWCALTLTLGVVLLVEGFLRAGLFVDQTAGFPDPHSLNAWQWFGNATLTESWRYLFAGSHPSYFLGHAWTLFYEEQFYIVAGLLLAIAPRRFFAATLVVTALTLTARHVAPSYGWSVQGSFLDGHWLMFAAGIGVYHFANHANGWQKLGTIALLVAAIAYACRDLALVRGLPNTFESNALCAFCFALILIAARRWDGAIMSAKWLAPIRFCGTICYSLYLVHWPICKGISHLAADAGVNGPWGAALVVLPCCIGASMAAGYAFHLAIERRFLNAPMGKA